MMPTENSVTGSAASGSDNYVNKTELARRLNKRVRTIDNWMARGIIPYLKIGTTVMFKWSDVEAHLQQTFRVCRRNLPNS